MLKKYNESRKVKTNKRRKTRHLQFKTFIIVVWWRESCNLRLEMDNGFVETEVNVSIIHQQKIHNIITVNASLNSMKHNLIIVGLY